jgi:hypothetical protein
MQWQESLYWFGFALTLAAWAIRVMHAGYSVRGVLSVLWVAFCWPGVALWCMTAGVAWRDNHDEEVACEMSKMRDRINSLQSILARHESDLHSHENSLYEHSNQLSQILLDIK